MDYSARWHGGFEEPFAQTAAILRFFFRYRLV